MKNELYALSQADVNKMLYSSRLVSFKVNIDTAIILIKAFCEQNFNEEFHSFQLIDMKSELLG